MAVRVSDFDLDCQNCDDILKAERGCTEKGKVPFEMDGERFFECPIKRVSKISWEYARAYTLYKKGYMPNGKGWIEESRKFLDAMKVIDNEVSAIEKEQIDKLKRKKPHGRR